MSDSTPKTHQTITAMLELSVPIGDYCLTTGRSLQEECEHLLSPFGQPRCFLFRTRLEITDTMGVIKCAKCKEAKVKI